MFRVNGEYKEDRFFEWVGFFVGTSIKDRFFMDGAAYNMILQEIT